MSALAWIRRRSSGGSDEQGLSVPAPVTLPPALGEEHAALERRRVQLGEQVAELHWDLGGLAYEMAIRDHFRLDVLVRRAAMLQEADAELAEVERMLRTQESGGVGKCGVCGAVRSRGAVFCWQCGSALMERAQSTAIKANGNAPESETLVQIPARGVREPHLGVGSKREIDPSGELTAELSRRVLTEPGEHPPPSSL